MKLFAIVTLVIVAVLASLSAVRSAKRDAVIRRLDSVAQVGGFGVPFSQIPYPGMGSFGSGFLNSRTGGGFPFMSGRRKRQTGSNSGYEKYDSVTTDYYDSDDYGMPDPTTRY